MNTQRNHSLAQALYTAEHLRTAIPPLTEQFPDLSIDDAYAIQTENVRRVQKEGQIISGKKIGLTSPGIQQQLGVDEPDYGHLFASMDMRDGRIRTDQLIQPKIEAEIAFTLKKDLSGGQVTLADVVEATNYVQAAFEIVDSRVADWKIKLIDTVSDNASSGRYVLGEKKLRLEEVDISGVTMELLRNGVPEQSGTAAAVLGNPCLAVAWLANCLFRYGVVLQKGEVILSGAFSAAPIAKLGDVFEARFSDFGSVKATFV